MSNNRKAKEPDQERQPDVRREQVRDEPAAGERSSVDGAPGIPAGSARVEDALETPDSDLGGVIASDTTPAGATGDAPSPAQVREDDRKRNTL